MTRYARFVAVVLVAAILIAGCGINAKVCRRADNALEDYNAAFMSIESALEVLYTAGKFSPDKYAKFCELRDKWTVAYKALAEVVDMCDTPETAQSSLAQVATLATLLVEIEALF